MYLSFAGLSERMQDLQQILSAYEDKIQVMLYHKQIDWEKRHLVWKHECRKWRRQGMQGDPYLEPQMYSESIIRKNNPIELQAKDLQSILEKIQKALN